jgi:hypothetical protein
MSASAVSGRSRKIASNAGLWISSTRTSDFARSDATRGRLEITAISPITSPAPRTASVRSPPTTSTSPSTITYVVSPGSPSAAIRSALKTLEDFDWSAQASAERPLVLHLAQLAWIEERANVCFLGPPGTGKTHVATALALRACEHGYRVAFATAQEWVSRLEQAQDRNQLEQELRRLERYHLLFALVSRRSERGSIIVTSNRGFEQWGEILGDAMVAAALIDRLVHHATMIALKGKSYRLRERGLEVAPAAQAPSLRDHA